jgi:HAE1 family hydrophobic/amphiphilic exporter-1
VNLSRFSIHRPIFAVMVTLIVIIVGVISLLRLPVDLMPDITYPSISVWTPYENASPEEVEKMVTRPIEQAVSAVPGVEEMTSRSNEGWSSVTVKFGWGANLDAAASDVRDRLDRVYRRLPEDIDRPTLWKYDSSADPILDVGVTSRLDPIQLRQLIEDQIRYRIERIAGVASLDVRGGLRREIHVDVDADKIKALALPLDQILTQLKAQNLNLPAGEIDKGKYSIIVRTPGEFRNLDEVANSVIATREGAPILLREVAQVYDGYERIDHRVRINGQDSIRMSVLKQSGTNTVEVARAVKGEIESINEDMPQLNLVVRRDSSDYIQRSITNVGYSALHGGVLSILILLLFLRSFRSTTVVAAAIPISIIATFGLMYFTGFTLNIMTMGGLALGIGRLVDDSIVVLENIYRRREGGESPELAAINGSNEVTNAVIASTLTTLAVFLPLVFVRGMAGILFKQLAAVVSFSLLCSLFVSLTLVPMLASKILSAGERHAHDHRRTIWRWLYDATGRFFGGMENGYRNSLRLALRHRPTVVAGAALLLAGSLALIPLVGVETMPQTDEGEVRVQADMEIGTRLELVDEKVRQIEDIVAAAVPEAKFRVSFVHSGSGGIRLTLTPMAERSRSSQQIADDLRRRLDNIPGVRILTRAEQSGFQLNLGVTGGDNLRIEIRGYDLDVADGIARRVKSAIDPIKGITDVRLSREAGRPEEVIQIDRQKASDLGLTVSQIANVLQTALSGTSAGNYRDGGSEYRILVKLRNAEQMDLGDILDLKLTSASGQPVVLRNVASIEPRMGPMFIDRKNQQRITYVNANVEGRDMGSVLADARQALRSVPVPRDFSISFGADYEEQQKAFRELTLSLVLALLLVYMVMACQYESLKDPFIVMFSVPLAAIGVVLALFLTDTTFNVQSYIGCIMLGGIVVSNAILLVDHTGQLRRLEGYDLWDAIQEAGRRRLRPILMTALTTMLGLLPLALGLGEGGEAQAPMARVVIGGLLSSTLITLVFVPVMYSVFEGGLGLRRRAIRDAEGRPRGTPGVDGPVETAQPTAMKVQRVLR